MAIALFSIGLLVSIMIHEWGHFATARRFGMRADRFFVGFGPTIWSFRKGETEYGVKALPLGGFVRIKGMSDIDERRVSVGATIFAPEAVAAERRQVSERLGTDVLEQPMASEATWKRADVILDERGTPKAMRARIIEQAQLRIDPYATPREAYATFDEVIAELVEDNGKGLRSLRHRLLRGDEGRFFSDRPAWQRAVVLVAGSTMHMVQAFVLLFFIAMIAGGPLAVSSTVSAIAEDTPAAEAGLQPGDAIVAVNGQRTDDFLVVRDVIRESIGQSVELTVLRAGTEVIVSAVPEVIEDPATGEEFGRFGFSPTVDSTGLAPHIALRDALIGEPDEGAFGVIALTRETAKSLGSVFGPSGLGSVFGTLFGGEERAPDSAASVVGAANIASDVSEQTGLLIGVGGLLASINVFIGIFNILPFPPLDGGHLAVLGIETAVNKRRPKSERDFSIDQRWIAAIALPVIVLVGTLSLGLVYLDIVSPIVMR